MKMRLLATSAMSLALATAAFAQSPSTAPTTSTTTPPAQNSTTTSTSTSTSPSTSTPAQNSTATGTSSSKADGSTTPSTSSTTSSSSQTPSTATGSSQAQTAPSSGSTTSSQQSTNPAPANNQAQQTSTSTKSGATAQQPNTQTKTAQSSGTHVNASVNINDQQRTRISQSFARVDARPLTNVNFSISVGTAIPRDVRLSPLPADVVEIVPQYRGYNYVLVKDEIVIVDPASYKIVTVIPYSGHSTAAAPARSKVSFSERDRAVIRKHAKVRAEGRTTGSTVRTELRVGERVPETVEIEAFPDEVYREAPELREYRYIHRENRTYVVDPRERMVIEEID
jgi:hypothetical protein